MNLLLKIAIRHLLARTRQSFMSILGIILGVAFFLAISSIMKGSENDFKKRLIDNSPHITIVDEYRNPTVQPANLSYKNALVEIKHLKPETENKGIRNYSRIIRYLKTLPGLLSSSVLSGQALINSSGKVLAVNLNGMLPEQIKTVTTIEEYMVMGSVNDLIANHSGIIIGTELARKLSVSLGNNITLTSTKGNVEIFKVIGLFQTGRSSIDSSQAYMDIKKAQSLLSKPNIVNSIIIKITTPYEAEDLGNEIEKHIGYKNISWQENSRDLMNTINIRNKILFTVVSAVLVVAAFGIYNVIFTVVMEKRRDIAILKSVGFYSNQIQYIFVIQGVILGIAGCCLGIPLGCIFIFGLSGIKMKPPGSTGVIQMPVDWGLMQFVIACAFAIIASVLAAYLPARKAAKVEPVEILRGAGA